MNLQQLLNYDEWANRRIFQEMKKIHEHAAFSEVQRLFSHILGAQLVWYSRITASKEKHAVWPEFSDKQMEQLLDVQPDKLKSLLSRAEEVISYSNSSGKIFNNSVGEILMHLVIHGQHHRAQIATLLREAGSTPPTTDFIFYLRTINK